MDKKKRYKKYKKIKKTEEYENQTVIETPKHTQTKA